MIAAGLEAIGEDFEIGLAMRGSLAAARSCVVAVMAFLAGCLADRRGKRWILTSAMLVMAAALLVMATAGRYASLLVGILLLGAAIGTLEGVVSPLTADLHPKRVDFHMNVLHGFYPLGLVVAGLFAGVALAMGVHWRVVVGALSLPALLTAVMFFGGRYPPAQVHVDGPLPVNRILRIPAFWPLAVVMFLTAGMEGTLTFWAPSFICAEYGSTVIVGASGIVVFGVAMAAGRFGTGFLCRFVSLPHLMLACGVACVIATLVLVVADSLWISFLAITVAGVCVACFWPGVLAMAARTIASGSATLMAMLSVAGVAGFGVLPWLAGLVGERYGLRIGLVLLPAGLAVAVLTQALSFRRR